METVLFGLGGDRYRSGAKNRLKPSFQVRERLCIHQPVMRNGEAAPPFVYLYSYRSYNPSGNIPILHINIKLRPG
jgi:hypothetical protein